MTAAAVLARARAAGVRLRLRPDGGLRVEADAPPSDALLGELREWRDDIVRLLAAQDRRSGPGTSEPGVLVGNDDDPEREAMAQHYAAEPSAQPYRPDTPDQLRDGLLASYRRHSARLAARAEGKQPCGLRRQPRC
jgi:hypothetical protein